MFKRTAKRGNGEKLVRGEQQRNRLCGASILETLEERRLFSAGPASALAANQPPVATPDTYTTADLNIFFGNILENDRDPEGDPLTARLVSGPRTSQGGYVSVTSYGSVDYTGPTSSPTGGDFTGDDTFMYVANDGTSDSQPVTVTLNVVPRGDIGEAQSVEGNGGSGVQRTVVFPVTLTKPSVKEIRIDYKTKNQTAGEGDYVVVPSATLTFAPGETQKDIVIALRGDTKVEGNETFQIVITKETNVSLNRGGAIGTIVNDDAPPVTPKIYVSDDEVFEGNSGTKLLTFNVVLSNTSTKMITVNFTTKNKTAGEGDYGVKSGKLTFAAGETSKSISVVVKGDRKVEGDEQFRIVLSNLVNVDAGRLEGIGQIDNDDD